MGSTRRAAPAIRRRLLTVNGYEFTREEDGFVLVKATSPAAAFSPTEWAAIVAAVSRRAGSESAKDDALTLHTMREDGTERELSASEIAAALPKGRT